MNGFTEISMLIRRNLALRKPYFGDDVSRYLYTTMSHTENLSNQNIHMVETVRRHIVRIPIHASVNDGMRNKVKNRTHQHHAN